MSSTAQERIMHTPADGWTERLGVWEEALRRLLEAKKTPEIGVFDAIGDLLLDAMLDGTQGVLEEAASGLRRVDGLYQRRASKDASWSRAGGRVEILLSLAIAASDRLVSEDEVKQVEIGGRAHQMLTMLQKEQSMPSRELVAAMGINSEQVSRLGSELAASRLVARAKFGREVFWDITPRGEEALEAAEERRRQTRERATRKRLTARRRTTGGIINADTHSVWRWDPAAIAQSLRRSGRVEERSRALFTSFAHHRREALDESLLVWNSYQRFAAGADDPLELRLLAPGTSDKEIERLTWEVLVEVRPSFERIERPTWPAPPPRWDGWAIVPGRNRRGIVFFEAKSQPEELKSLPFRRTADWDHAALLQILDSTRKELGAAQAWDLWPRHADPAARLAFLHQLQTVGIDAWWLNVYFVDPDRRLDKVPASAETWWTHIYNAREELDILTREHTPQDTLRRYVKHDVFKVPDEALDLAGAATSSDDA